MSKGEPFIEVVAAVVHRDGRLLLCQRHDGPHLPLMWEFPGGKIDRGEEPRDALRRELTEELAVAAEVGALLATVRHRYPEKNVSIRFYAASLDGEPRALVHRRVQWIPLEELDGYEVPPANAPVIHKILVGELVAW